MTDDLKERLRHVDEYEPLGHDGWEALARITDLEARLAASNEEASRLFMENVGLISRLTEAEAGEDALAEALLDGAQGWTDMCSAALAAYETRRKG